MAKPEGGPVSPEVYTSQAVDSHMRKRNENVFRRARNWGIGIFLTGIAVASAALTLPISTTAAVVTYIAGGVLEATGLSTWITSGILKHTNRTVQNA